MKVMKVLYFASVRERVGTTAEDVDPPSSVRTVADLIAWLRNRGPHYEHAFGAGGVMAAVDRMRAPADAPVGPGSEVAFFPPMTGG